MKNLFKKKCLREKAQSATELAVFGAILIFVIGLIVRSAMSYSNTMNSQLKAMRYAMSESYRTSEGQYGGDETMAARNSASVLLIEDRLSADSGDKFQTRDRVPFIASASATHSKNLFYPTDFGDSNLPLYDVFVNGQRFPFTVAAYRTVTLPTDSGTAAGQGIFDCSVSHPNDTRCWDHTCLAGAGCVRLQTTVGNYPSSDNWDDTLDERFDLDFDGNVDVAAGSNRDDFYWQWMGVSATTGGIDPENNLNTSVDVDGDFHEEGVMEVAGTDGAGRITALNVMDYQSGDLNFSYDDRDEDKYGPQQIAIQGEDIQMYSFTQDGTIFRIEEGKLFDPGTGQFVRTTNRQQHVDIIQRAFYISNDTGRFCIDGAPPATVGGIDNPVEACGDCFSEVNIEKTCMDAGANIIFIRSRIRDLRGRRWVTRFN